jgi:hypothetical protein
MARRFVDARGTEWEVWEVGLRRTLADVPPARRRGSAEETPSLLFASATQRRRLAPYPERWHAMGPHELSELCAAARPEPSASVLPYYPRGPTSPRMRG